MFQRPVFGWFLEGLAAAGVIETTNAIIQPMIRRIKSADLVSRGVSKARADRMSDVPAAMVGPGNGHILH